MIASVALAEVAEKAKPKEEPVAAETKKDKRGLLLGDYGHHDYFGHGHFDYGHHDVHHHAPAVHHVPVHVPVHHTVVKHVGVPVHVPKPYPVHVPVDRPYPVKVCETYVFIFKKLFSSCISISLEYGVRVLSELVNIYLD